jgi:hypothetical protein
LDPGYPGINKSGQAHKSTDGSQPLHADTGRPDPLLGRHDAFVNSRVLALLADHSPLHAAVHQQRRLPQVMTIHWINLGF